MLTTRMLSVTLGLAALLGIFLASGCDEDPSAGMIEIKGDTLPTRRIVTLAPSLTQMLVDLRLENEIVGVARNDDSAPSGSKIVGDIFDINTEALLSTRPTHVFIMTTKEGVPARLRDLAARGSIQLLSYPSPTSINQVGAILLDETEFMAPLPVDASTPPILDPSLPAAPAPPAAVPGSPAAPRLELFPGGKTFTSLGTILGIQLQAQQVKLHMMLRLGKLGQITENADQPKPKVLVVIGLNPLLAVGPGTVLHELLGTINAINVTQEASVGAPVIDREKLLELQPDIIVILSPKAAPLENLDTDARLAIFKDLALPALRNKKIVLINDPLVLLPSSSLDRAAALLAKAIYPQHTTAIDDMMKQDLFKSLPTPKEEPLPVIPPAASTPAAPAATAP